MKDIPKLGFTGPREALAEKFHMSEQLLSALNPGQHFDRAGDKIIVVDASGGQTRDPAKADIASIMTNPNGSGQSIGNSRAAA